MAGNRRRQDIPLIPVEQAWRNLACDVLLLAIEDVRKDRDQFKREMAKYWLLSPVAKLFFDALLPMEIDIETWVKAGCPQLGK